MESSSSTAFSSKIRADDRLLGLAQTMVNPQQHVHEFFDTAFEFHSELVLEFNMVNLENICAQTAEFTQQALQRAVLQLAESESTDKPAISSDSAKKLILLLLRSIYMLQFVHVFPGIILVIMDIFEGIRAQETNYFDVNNLNEEILILVLQILAVECGKQPKELLSRTGSYKLDCSIVQNEINKQMEVYMSQKVVSYEKQQFELTRVYVREAFIPIQPSELQYLYKILKHIIFNFSRLYYITDERICQLVFGLQIFDQILSATKKNSQLLPFLFENVQTSELIFIAGILNPEMHQIFKQYKNKYQHLPEALVIEIGFIALQSISKLFSLQQQQPKLNSKLFNANFCSNLQQFLKSFVQKQDWEDIEAQFLSKKIGFNVSTKFPTSKTEIKQQNGQFLSLKMHLMQFLQQNYFKIFVVFTNLQEIAELLPQCIGFEAANCVVEPVQIEIKEFIDQKLKMPQQLINMQFRTFFDYGFESYLKFNIYKKKSQFHELNFNPFKELNPQLQCFIGSGFSELNQIETTSQFNPKLVEEQRIKYLISLFTIFNTSEHFVINLLHGLILNDFVLMNQKADQILADFCVLPYLFSNKTLFALNADNKAQNQFKTLIYKEIIHNLLLQTEGEQKPMFGHILKLIESNISENVIVQQCIQILQFLTQNEEHPEISGLYESLTEQSLKLTPSILFVYLMQLTANALLDVKNDEVLNDLAKLVTKLKPQSIPNNLFQLCIMFPKAVKPLQQLYCNSSASLIQSNNFEFTLIVIGQLLCNTAKIDFQSDDFDFQRCQSLLILQILQTVFDPVSNNEQILHRIVGECDEFLDLLSELLKTQVKDAAKQKYLSTKLIPGVIKLISQMSQFNVNVIIKFVQKTKLIPLQISEQMIDEIIALIISKPGKLMHEPLDLLIFNVDSISAKQNEKLIQSIADILNFQLEYSAIDRKYPQFCHFALQMLEKTVHKDWPVEVKVEQAKNLISMAVKADFINLFQILTILRLIINNIEIPIMRDFLEGLYTNMMDASSVPITQFVFQSGAGMNFKFNTNSKQISVLFNFKTRPMKQDNPIMCLFSLQSNNASIGCYLRTVCQSGQNELVLRNSFILNGQEQASEASQMELLVTDGKESCITISMQQVGDEISMTTHFDLQPILTSTFKGNLSVFKDAIMFIGYNKQNQKVQIHKHSNHFIGSMRVFTVFEDFLIQKNIEELLSVNLNYHEAKLLKTTKKCKYWFSAFYTLNDYALNMAVNLCIQQSIFTSLQKHDEPVQFQLQNDLVATMQCETRKTQPLEIQLKFVSGPNLFLSLIKILINSANQHHQTLESILKLITMVMSKQITERDENTELSISALIALLHKCPNKYLTPKSMELLQSFIEFDIPSQHKIQIQQYLYNLDYMKSTNVLHNAIILMRSNINNQNVLMDEQFASNNIKIDNQLVIQILQSFNALGISIFTFIDNQTIDNESVLDIKEQQKLLDLQEKSLMNTVLVAISWANDSQMLAINEIICGKSSNIEVKRLITLIIQTLIILQTDEVIQSCLNLIKFAIIMNLIDKQVIELLVSKLKIDLRNHGEIFIDLMFWKLKQVKNPQLIVLIIQCILVYCDKFTNYRQIPIYQLQVDVAQQLVVKSYEEFYNVYIMALEKENIFYKNKLQRDLIGNNYDTLISITDKMTNNQLIQLATSGILTFYNKQPDPNFSVVNPFIFTLRPSLITDLSSFEHNLKVFINLDEFYEFLKDDYNSKVLMDKIIPFIYKKLNIFGLQQLISNMTRLEKKLPSLFSHCVQCVNDQNQCITMSSAEFKRSISFSCQALSFYEDNTQIVAQSLRDLIIEMIKDKLNLVNKPKAKKEKLSLEQFIISEDFQDCLIETKRGKVDLLAIIKQIVLNKSDIQIVQPEIQEIKRTKVDFDEIKKQIIKNNKEITHIKENQQQNQFQIAQIQINQILHRSAIIQAEAYYELSQVEAVSRIRNKIIPTPVLNANPCTLYIYKQENVKHLQVKGIDIGTILLSYEENGHFVIFFQNNEQVIKIRNISDIIHQRYLFEWNSCEVVTAQHEFYYFIFSSFDNCLEFINSVAKYSNFIHKMKQQESLTSYFEIPELSQFQETQQQNQHNLSLIDQLKSSTDGQIAQVFIRKFNDSSYMQPKLILDSFQKLSATQLWVRRCISNYDYLMIINTYAGRTFNDLAHYPIFPWILQDYTSESIDLDDHQIYRDFSMPIGSQGMENKMRQIFNKFKQSQELVKYTLQLSDDYQAFSYQDIYGTNIPASNKFDPLNGDVFAHVQAYHHACFYSTAAYVSHYLVRLQPYTQRAIDLDKRIDVDRGFKSIPSAFLNIWSNDQDNRELIPEFFTLPQMFLDSQKIGIGNVELPPWASSPENFIKIHRQALESEFVSQNLNFWIDLIFGFRQQGIPAAEKMNTFGQSVFYETQIRGLKEGPMKQTYFKQAQSMATHFGHAPAIVFDKAHPQRLQIKKQTLVEKNQVKILDFPVSQSEILNIYLESSLVLVVETSQAMQKVELKDKIGGSIIINRVKPISEITQIKDKFSTLFKETILEDSVAFINPTKTKTFKNEVQYLYIKNKAFKRNICAFDGQTLLLCNFIDDSIQSWDFNKAPTIISCYAHVTCIDYQDKVILFGCADGSVSMLGEQGMQPVCNLHSEVTSVSVCVKDDFMMVSSRDKVQIYSLMAQFIKQIELSDVKYLKLHKNTAYAFTSTQIIALDVPSLLILKRVALPIQVEDLAFGCDFFVICGEKVALEYKCETLELTNKFLCQEEAKSVQICAGEQLIVVGRSDGVLRFIQRVKIDQ